MDPPLQLTIFPLKSCNPVHLDTCPVSACGLERDREFAFARQTLNGSYTCLTLRECPKLAQVGIKHISTSLVVLWIEHDEYQIPLTYSSTIQCRLWKEKLHVHASPLPSEILDVLDLAPSTRLVSLLSPREIYRNAPRHHELGYQPHNSGFSDAYPIHLINLASLDALNEYLAPLGFPEIKASRFRANIIVHHLPAYSEDHWTRVAFVPPDRSSPMIVCRVVSRMVRCNVINVDPETALMDKSAHLFNTIKKFRNIDSGAPSWPCFGMSLVPEFNDTRTITTQHTLQVLETCPHHYIPI